MRLVLSIWALLTLALGCNPQPQATTDGGDSPESASSPEATTLPTTGEPNSSPPVGVPGDADAASNEDAFRSSEASAEDDVGDVEMDRTQPDAGNDAPAEAGDAVACSVPAVRRAKLIEYGWAMPTAAFLASVPESPTRRPFDGVVWAPTAKFTNRFFTGDDYAPFVPSAEMRANARRGLTRLGLTENFIRVDAGGDRTFSMDSEELWAKILNHAKLAAAIAQETGSRGLLMDTEPYIYGDSWSLALHRRGAAASADLDERVLSKARERGVALMDALQKEKPDIVVVITFMAKFGPPGKTDVLPHFLGGMLEALRAPATIIDGMEENYTPVGTYERVGHEKYGTTAHRNIVRSELPTQAAREAYRTTPLARGVYADGHFVLHGDGDPNNTTQDELHGFEHHLHMSLVLAQRYVWMFNEQSNWWGSSEAPFGHPSALTGPFPKQEEAIRRVQALVAQGEPPPQRYFYDNQHRAPGKDHGFPVTLRVERMGQAVTARVDFVETRTPDFPNFQVWSVDLVRNGEFFGTLSATQRAYTWNDPNGAWSDLYGFVVLLDGRVGMSHHGFRTCP